MKKCFLCSVLFFVATACYAVGTVYVTLAYKWNGVPKQDTIILGVGGKQEPDYDNTNASSASYNIGQWDYSFNSATGLDLRFGISRGYKQFEVGRQEHASVCYRYRPKNSSSSRMNFGQTYELDISSDYSKTNQLTDVVVSTTPFLGKKITNMTGSPITLGLGWGGGSQQYTIPNNSAILYPEVITTFAYNNYNASWECHSEQDWDTTFSPTVYSTIRQDFPQFANLVFYKASTKPTIYELSGALVFGDMKSSSGTNILFGASGYPLYSIRDFLDSVTVMTEWVFDQNEIPSPSAYINGVDVCSWHTTTHIIDYKIVSNDNWTYNKTARCYYIDFTMSLSGNSSVSSPSVVQRCWVNKYSTFDDAPAAEKASVDGCLGNTATFRLTQNIVTGEITLTAM